MRGDDNQKLKKGCLGNFRPSRFIASFSSKLSFILILYSAAILYFVQEDVGNTFCQNIKI